MMHYQQGDVVSVLFPFTDLSNAKLRPALVISNSLVANTGDLIIVMITSKERDDGINLEINSGDINFALPRKSFVRCHRIATIDENIVDRKFATVTKEFIAKVLASVKILIEAMENKK